MSISFSVIQKRMWQPYGLTLLCKIGIWPTTSCKRCGSQFHSHCLDLDLNGLLTRRNFWRIPGMLGNYMIPKWKEFLKSRKPILRKSLSEHFHGVGLGLLSKILAVKVNIFLGCHFQNFKFPPKNWHVLSKFDHAPNLQIHMTTFIEKFSQIFCFQEIIFSFKTFSGSLGFWMWLLRIFSPLCWGFP